MYAEVSEVVGLFGDLFVFVFNVLANLPITSTLTVAGVFVFFVVIGLVLWFANVISSAQPTVPAVRDEVGLDE